MSIKYRDFKSYVVEPVLADMGLGAEDRAAHLLMAIAAHESLGVKYLDQMDARHRDGPAYGPFQFEKGGGFAEVHRLMEADSRGGLDPARDVWEKYKVDDIRKLRQRLDSAVFYARVLLYPDRASIPASGNWDHLYAYYIRRWGPGKPPSLDEFLRAHANWKHG